MDPKKVEEKMREARMHLEFCMNVYRLQIKSGRYFIHEHPKSATSWREPMVERIAREDGVIKVDLDMLSLIHI